MFAHQTNVDMNSRITVFDIFDLGKQLKTVGMLVMLDAILNRVTANRQLGKRAHIFIDEIYLFFANEYSSNFLAESWKRFRKSGALVTGITQNIEDCLRSATARTMLANSEFLLMLNQAPTDRMELARLLNISDTQLSYITNAEAGHGLIKVGGAASQHTYCEDISWDEAQIGDLAFYPDDEHIGIVAGWDENGNILIVHCASGYNNVVITGKEGFVSIGRPLYFPE